MAIEDGFIGLVKNEVLSNMSMRQFTVLMVMANTAEPQTIRGLSDRLSCPKPSMTRAVDALELLGLARRIVDPKDHRSVLVTVSKKGAELVSNFGKIIKAPRVDA